MGMMGRKGIRQFCKQKSAFCLSWFFPKKLTTNLITDRNNSANPSAHFSHPFFFFPFSSFLPSAYVVALAASRRRRRSWIESVTNVSGPVFFHRLLLRAILLGWKRDPFTSSIISSKANTSNSGRLIGGSSPKEAPTS